MSLFISIFGPDGSGKSTHAMILAKYLIDHGFKVRVVWIKSYHTLAYVLSRVFVRLTPYFVVRNPYGTVIRINAVNNGSLGSSMWSWIDFISVLPLVILRVYLPLLIGRVIVAERYLIDSVVSMGYALNNPDFQSSFVAKAMLRLIPKRAVLIYLDSDYAEIERRRGVMADPEDFICFQKLMYDRLSRSLGAFRIDTSRRSIEDTARIVRSHLNLDKA